MVRSALILMLAAGLFSAMLSRSLSQITATANSAPTAPQAATVDASPGHYDSNVTTSGDGLVTLERQPNGHFYADVEINGATIHALVDTGATGIALSREDARSAGVATSIGMPNVVGQGADGEVHGEFVKLDRVTLGGTTVEGMPAMVLNSGEQSLLGQEFLARFAAVEIHGDTMVLR